MKKDLQGRFYCKSILESVVLTAISLFITVGSSTVFVGQKFENPLSKNVPQTQNQKVEVLARVVPDVDAIKRTG